MVGVVRLDMRLPGRDGGAVAAHTAPFWIAQSAFFRDPSILAR
jgi:hypothetical protein